MRSKRTTYDERTFRQRRSASLLEFVVLLLLLCLYRITSAKPAKCLPDRIFTVKLALAGSTRFLLVSAADPHVPPPTQMGTYPPPPPPGEPAPQYQPAPPTFHQPAPGYYQPMAPQHTTSNNTTVAVSSTKSRFQTRRCILTALSSCVK